MEKQLKIATWNLCLGLSNKKDTVLRYLSENEIKICCLQETEIPLNFPENVLNCGNYNLELEMNSEKKEQVPISEVTSNTLEDLILKMETVI